MDYWSLRSFSNVNDVQPFAGETVVMDLKWISLNSITKGLGIVLIIGFWSVINSIDYSAITDGMVWVSAILIPVFLAFFGFQIMFWDVNKAFQFLQEKEKVVK